MDVQVTALFIPCPHCTMWRKAIPGRVGDAECPGCGTFVRGDQWRDSFIETCASLSARDPDDPWAEF